MPAAQPEGQHRVQGKAEPNHTHLIRKCNHKYWVVIREEVGETWKSERASGGVLTPLLACTACGGSCVVGHDDGQSSATPVRTVFELPVPVETAGAHVNYR